MAHLSGAEVDRLCLLDHDETRNLAVSRQLNMKREALVGGGNGADYAHACMAVEELVADDQRRPAPLLLVA